MGHGRPELRYHAGHRKTLQSCFKKVHSRNRMKLIHNNTTRNVTRKIQKGDRLHRLYPEKTFYPFRTLPNPYRVEERNSRGIIQTSQLIVRRSHSESTISPCSSSIALFKQMIYDRVYGEEIETTHTDTNI